MGKWGVNCNVKLLPNYFSGNVSVLAVVYRQQILKNQQLPAKLWILWILVRSFFGSDFDICVAQKQETFEDQDLIIRDVKRYLH